MKIINVAVKGSGRQKVLNQLHPLVDTYREDSVFMYIGITSDYQERAEAHASEYDEMILIYQTASKENVRALERDLIEHYQEYLENENAGGGGALGDPPHYLYIVRVL